ncbi:hypothetical protein SK128_024870 [Halocaridina rubra]|uniref:Uncharacterized protein n=1 Tax=Halocaridina rubra TaxID=373956 RepID=A0AAN9AB39_HALRR
MEHQASQNNLTERNVVEKSAISNLTYISKYGSASEYKLDESGGIAGVKSFEDLLEIVGTKGKWNYIIFFICSMCTFITPMQSITYQFLGATPDYWCHVGPLVEANWTLDQIFNLAIPSE